MFALYQAYIIYLGSEAQPAACDMTLIHTKCNKVPRRGLAELRFVV